MTPRRTKKKRTRTPQQERSKEKVDRILSAATTCFDTKGYAKTTMSHIAREADVSTGTVYAYFTDKDDVLKQIMHAHAENMLQPSEKYLSELEEDARVRDVLITLLNIGRVRRNQHIGLHRVFHERINKDKNFHAIAQTYRTRAMEIGMQLVRRFGSEAAKGNSAAAAALVIAVLEHCSHTELLPNNPVNFEDASKACTEMIEAYFSI